MSKNMNEHDDLITAIAVEVIIKQAAKAAARRAATDAALKDTLKTPVLNGLNSVSKMDVRTFRAIMFEYFFDLAFWFNMGELYLHDEGENFFAILCYFGCTLQESFVKVMNSHGPKKFWKVKGAAVVRTVYSFVAKHLSKLFKK